MALSNSYKTTNAVNVPEQVLKDIDRIEREETPILSSAQKMAIKSRSPEWQTQALAAAGDNAQAEGAALTINARTATVRVKNQTQIMSKGVSVTGTNQAVDHYGYGDELAYQKKLATIELRRDMEAAIVGNAASVVGAPGDGSDGTAGKLGGIESWATSNVSRGTGGSNGGYTAGLTVAATDGTQRLFTEDLLLNVLQTGYDNGARFSVGHFGAFNKQRRFSTFQGNSTRMSEKEKGVVNDIKVYETAFGTLTAAINPRQRARTGILYDMSKIAILTLRPISIVKKAKTNDSDEEVILTEFTTKVVEKGIGIIADLTTA